MRHIRSKDGPFSERPHFKLSEIEQICTDELTKVDLYPSSPQPIRIDRFIEKRFRIAPEYQDLPAGVLGFTKFGPRGVEAIVIAKTLDDGGEKVVERRLRSTFAHEGGHGLLHAHLFHLGEKPKSLFDDADRTPRILCRDMPDAPPVARGYDGRWWEFQANKAIGGLLMPRRLVEMALVTEKLCLEAGNLGQLVLPPEKREAAVRTLADMFDVNPAVARLRVDDIFPKKRDAQLLL
jgi:hypothetical protein